MRRSIPENDVAQDRHRGDAPAEMSAAQQESPIPQPKKSSGGLPKDSVSVAPVLSEEQIDAPSRQTLIMLSFVFAATLIFWAAGRAACNYQVPGESLTPRAVPLEERTRLPKDVGIEFAQAISGGDFEVGRQLASGAAVGFLESEKASCGSCAERKAQRAKLLSVGVVLQGNSIDTLVEVRTLGAPSGPQVRLLGIERVGRLWRVTRIVKNQSEFSLKKLPEQPPSPSDAAANASVMSDEQPAAIAPGASLPAPVPGSPAPAEKTDD